MRWCIVSLVGLAIMGVSMIDAPAFAELTAATPSATSERAWPEKPRVERLRGKVSPSREVTLGVPVDGILSDIHVEEGERVRAGEVLAAMDDSLQRLTVEAARLRSEQAAPRRRAQLLLAQATDELQRLEQLRDREAASAWEVRQARLERDQAEAALQEVREAEQLAAVEYKLEQQRLAQYQVKAPFDGVVWRIEAEAGAALTRNDEVLVLLAFDPLEAELHLPIAMYRLLEVGRSYRLSPEAGGPVTGELRGQLTRIDPVMDVASRTFRCVFEIDNPDLKRPAGFNVELVWPPVAQDDEAAAAILPDRAAADLADPE